MEIDLNNDLQNLDMQEVIINLAAAPDAFNGGFLELNDLEQEADEEVIHLMGQNQGFDLNDPPENQEQLDQQQDHVEVRFPHLNFPLQPMIDAVIPIHMLMDDFEQEEVDDPQMEDAANNLLNVGAVLISEQPFGDPIFLQRQSNSREGCSEFWLTATENTPRKKVKIAAHWGPFFASLLLSPGSYKWAKSFIESEAWAFFNNSLKSTFIKVLDQCSVQKISCTISECSSSFLLPDQKDIESQLTKNTTAKKDKKKRTPRTPTVESEVRRSPRLKETNKGFKPGICISKKCLTCTPNPLDMSLTMIKDIGANLFQLDENLLSEKALNQKMKKFGKAIADSDDIIQKKEKASKTGKKKLLKENKKPDPDVQEEDGANPASPGKATPKKNSKK